MVIDEEDLARRLAATLESMPEVQLAYLFGSHASGRARADSDIDLGVAVAPEAPSPRKMLGMLFDRLGRVAPSDRLDIVLLNRAPSLLRHRILSSGRLLFARRPEARVRFATRTLRDYQDMQVRREFFYRKRLERLREGRTQTDREIFSRRLATLRSYLERLEAFRATTEQEFRDSPAIHDLAERYLHLAMECALDLGNHFIADAGLPAPETNQDTFTRLEKAKAISPDLAARLRAWAGFRNILVHQYLDIDHGIAWNSIQNELGDLRAFADWATRQLE